MTNEEFYKKHGGVVHPTHDSDGCGNMSLREWGMTRREHFAGEALKATLSGNATWRDLDFKPRDGNFSMMEQYAICAYEMADAMIKIGQLDELPA